MNEVQVFDNPKFGEIRTVTENGKTLFCGKDVAKALGYKNTSKALADHCKGVTKRYYPSNGGQQEMNFIPQGDIYRLAAKSELPGAEEFESWIFDEVLPSIHEYGGYLTPELAQQMAEGLTAINDALQNLNQRLLSLETAQAEKRTPLQKVADGENPFADAPVAMRPDTIKIRKRWMRVASEKLNALADKCGISSNLVIRNVYGEMEDELGVCLDDVRIKALEQHQLDDCSYLVAIFYDRTLRQWFENRVDTYLTAKGPTWKSEW